jgi:ABC-2 type transport system ATP-binding protein
LSNIWIEAEGVCKSFEGQTVLRDVSFTVNRGEIVGLLGPNGSGKTTMIRLLNGVIEPDSGRMAVGGYDPVSEGTPVRRMSGILTEGAGLYHEMSGLENLRFFAQLYGVSDEARIASLLEQFDLAEHQHKSAGTYSTGMKKRLGMAKALLHRPALLFLDEPTNGLDPEGIRMVMRYLKELNEREGTTIFLCSHVLHQIETVCHSYLFMEKGRIMEAGTQKEIERKYMKTIDVRVETGLTPAGPEFAGFPVRRESSDSLLFTLPSKDDIPALLRAILEQSWVHTTEIMNRDLESLYFRVRGEQIG